MIASDIATANPTIELVDSNPIVDRPQALLERAADDGYLFFRGLLDPDTILNVRARLMSVSADQGWLRKDPDPMLGLVDKAQSTASGLRTDPTTGVAYRKGHIRRSIRSRSSMPLDTSPHYCAYTTHSWAAT